MPEQLVSHYKQHSLVVRNTGLLLTDPLHPFKLKMLNAYDVRVELQLSDTRNHGVLLFNSFYCALEMQLVTPLWHLGVWVPGFKMLFIRTSCFQSQLLWIFSCHVEMLQIILDHIFKIVIHSKMYWIPFCLNLQIL